MDNSSPVGATRGQTQFAPNPVPRRRGKFSLGVFLTLLLAHAHAADLNGVSIWAVSSDPTILPNDQIVLTVVDNALVVHLTTLPDAEGEVEVSFYALIDDQPIRLALHHGEPEPPTRPTPVRLFQLASQAD